jgi:FAD/FMN-containing dehydrogenase
MAAIGRALEVFRSRFGGDVLVPEDEAYEDVRALWNGAFDKRPAVIARCRATDDIVEVIRFAHESGLPLAVRGGGHSLAGLSSCDDGIMLDLSV